MTFRTRTARLAVATACAGLATSAIGGGAAAAHTRAAAAPHHPAPTAFTHGRVDNPYLPLKPGTVSIFRGSKDGKRARDVVFVAYRTQRIDGVVCRLVKDRLFLNGRLEERTTDFYAQTRKGTVWYFGEHTAELDKQGHVTNRDGSFESGRDGAQAGIFMPAQAKVGFSARQEDYPGQAEDHFRIVDLNAHITVPLVSSRHAMLTRETTPLEPKVVDHKFYVRDIGVVLEKTVRGGRETNRLVALRHRPRG